MGPLLKKVVEAELPGLSVSIETLKAPEFSQFTSNPKAIAALGLGIFKSSAGDKFAIYNGEVVKPEEVDAIDKAGKLSEIFPPVESLLGQTSAAATPQEGNPPGTPPAANGSILPPTPPPPSGAVRPIAAQRAKAGASKGPLPSGGSILNSLLKKSV